MRINTKLTVKIGTRKNRLANNVTKDVLNGKIFVLRL